jgi:hypothetical protein
MLLAVSTINLSSAAVLATWAESELGGDWVASATVCRAEGRGGNIVLKELSVSTP